MLWQGYGKEQNRKICQNYTSFFREKKTHTFQGKCTSVKLSNITDIKGTLYNHTIQSLQYIQYIQYNIYIQYNTYNTIHTIHTINTYNTINTIKTYNKYNTIHTIHTINT